MSKVTVVDEPLQPTDYRAVEADLLDGLLQAGEDLIEETAEITIRRKDRYYFSFRIRPLTEAEYNDCRKQSTTFRVNKNFGNLKLPEDQDLARFRSLLIYTATVPEDRAALWDAPAARQKFGVMGPLEVIDRVLKPGEKADIIDRIDELSGYGVSLEETAKN